MSPPSSKVKQLTQVVPFVRLQIAVFGYFGKRVYHVRAQLWVDIFGKKLTETMPILTPVGVITHNFKVFLGSLKPNK